MASVLLAALTVAALASEPQRPELLEYLAVAETYRSGQRSEARTLIERWPWHRVDATIRDLERSPDRLRQSTDDPEQIDLGTVEAAILMHTELALLAVGQKLDRQARPHLATAARLVEWLGHVTGEREAHRREGTLPPGRKLSPRLVPRDLFVALARALLANGNAAAAGEFAARARQAAPGDAEVLEVLGATSETRALEARVQGRDGKAEELAGIAELQLRTALDLEPGRLEARLRLGHVLLGQGKATEAEALLREARSQAVEPRQRYLAFLFLGRALERQGRAEAAIAAYRQAVAVWPDSQAARIALAQRLEEGSGLDPARALVAESLEDSARSDRRPDPWWSYAFGDRDDAEASVRRLWETALAR